VRRLGVAKTPVSEVRGRDLIGIAAVRLTSTMSDVLGTSAVTLPPPYPLRHQPHASLLRCICRFLALTGFNDVCSYVGSWG
jgi:hypothetical protein